MRYNLFYHSEKLQSTKTATVAFYRVQLFYHSEKLQSTKTIPEQKHLLE